MDVLQHRHLLETVGMVLDLEVNVSFCAPMFTMSITNLIYREKSVWDDLNVLVRAVSKLFHSTDRKVSSVQLCSSWKNLRILIVDHASMSRRR